MKTDLQNISLKKITQSEIPLFVKFRIEYLRELQGASDENNENLLKKDLENHFRRELAANRFFAFWIEKENQPVSFGAVVVKQIPGDFLNSTYFEGDVLNMYTVPSGRKQGYAALILEAMILEAKNRGISKLSLHTTKDGERLYRIKGFTEPSYPYLEMIVKKDAFCH